MKTTGVECWTCAAFTTIIILRPLKDVAQVSLANLGSAPSFISYQMCDAKVTYLWLQTMETQLKLA